MTEELWLLKKRDLYERPNHCGYTGIRDHAGRYTAEEARAHVGNGVSMIRLDIAPEFTGACFEDLARDHLAKQRDAALGEVERLRAVLEDARRDLHGIFPQSQAQSVYKRRTEKVIKRIEAAITTSQRGTE